MDDTSLISPTAAAPKKQRQHLHEYAFESFNARRVMTRLSKGAGRHGWRDKILFAAICSWTLSRGDIFRVRQAIIQTLVQIMLFEEKALKLKRTNTSSKKFSHLSSLAAYWNPSLRLMFKNVYEPVGGLSAIMAAKPKSVAAQELMESAIGVDHIVMLMAIQHLHSTIDEPYHQKLKLERAAQLASKLLVKQRSGKTATPLTIRNAWDRHHASAALIYAASLRRVGKTSLLVRLISNPPAFKEGRARGWLELARRVNRDLLRHCDFKFTRKADTFPKLRRVKLPPPDMRLCDAKWLVEMFDDMNPNWEDVAKQVRCGMLAPKGRTEDVDLSLASCAQCKKFSGRFDRNREPVMRS